MRKKSKVLILIPSRFGSSRFPGKSLSAVVCADGTRKSLVEVVYENCSASGFETVVVTDHREIEKKLRDSQMSVVRVDDEVASGTERIALAYKRFFQENDYDFILNVQGDEPLLQANDLEKLINFHESSPFDIGTLVKKRESSKETLNPNEVKVAMNENSGLCLYFSRSFIPYERFSSEYWLQHIGVYSYRPKALEEFVRLAPSRLERIEGLEQLRALEHGMRIGAIETDTELIGVDSPEDLEKLNHYLAQRKSL